MEVEFEIESNAETLGGDGEGILFYCAVNSLKSGLKIGRTYALIVNTVLALINSK